MDASPAYVQKAILDDLNQLGICGGQFCPAKGSAETHFVLTLPNPYLDDQKAEMLKELEEEVVRVDFKAFVGEAAHFLHPTLVVPPKFVPHMQ